MCFLLMKKFPNSIAWGSPEKGGPMLEKIPLKKFAEICDITNVVLYVLVHSKIRISFVELIKYYKSRRN